MSSRVLVAAAVIVLATILVAIALLRDGNGEIGGHDSAEPPADRPARSVPGRHASSDPSGATAPFVEHSLESSNRTALEVVGLHVFVVDEATQPIPSARIYTRDAAGKPVVVGMTDANGRTVLSAEPRPSVVGAWAKGLLPEDSRVAESDEEVTLVLREGASIAGRVFWVDGSPFGDDALVACWTTGHQPQQLVHSPATIPRWTVVPTAPDGSFRITGLTEGQHYTVTAVAPWAVMTDPLYGIVPGGGPLALTVSPLHGLDLVVSGPDGARLHVDPQLGSAFVTVGTGVGRAIAPRRPELALLGIAAADVPPGQRVRRLLYTASAHLETVGPFSFGFSYPGYSPANGEVVVPRLASPTPPLRRIELSPEHETFGTLRVTLTGTSELAAAVHARQPVGMIRLREVSTDSPSPRPWLCAVGAGQREVTLETLPAGTWDVSWLPDVRVPGVTTLGGPVRVEVGGGAAEAAIDVGPNGTVAIEILESAEHPYTGSAAFTLYHVGLPTASNVSFDTAPYLLTMIPPGRYELSVMCPHPGGIEGLRSSEFLVSPGITTELVIPRPEAAGSYQGN